MECDTAAAAFCQSEPKSEFGAPPKTPSKFGARPKPRQNLVHPPKSPSEFGAPPKKHPPTGYQCTLPKTVMHIPPV